MNGSISDVLALMFQPEAGADIDRKAVASIHRDEPDNRGQKGGQPLCCDIFNYVGARSKGTLGARAMIHLRSELLMTTRDGSYDWWPHRSPWLLDYPTVGHQPGVGVERLYPPNWGWSSSR